MAFPRVRLCFVIVILSVAISVLVDPSVADKKRLCGRALTDALQIICDSNYNVMHKKSMFNDEYYNDQGYLEDDYQLQYPRFISKLAGGIFKPRVARRARQGVSDECCKKPCSYKELTSYCKEPPSNM